MVARAGMTNPATSLTKALPRTPSAANAPSPSAGTHQWTCAERLQVHFWKMKAQVHANHKYIPRDLYALKSTTAVYTLQAGYVHQGDKQLTP